MSELTSPRELQRFDDNRAMAISYSEAIRLVTNLLEQLNANDRYGPQAIWPEMTQEASYGWYFVVQDERFVRTKDPSHKRIGGKHAIIVTKIDGKVHFPIRGRRADWEGGEGAAYIQKTHPHEPP